MILLTTTNSLYLAQGNCVLKCCKSTMKLSVCSIEESTDAIELGKFVAFIGKILIENECYLLVAVECTPVATYPCTNDTISHIDRVIAIPVVKDDLPYKKKVLHFVTRKGNAVRLIDEILRLFNGGDFYICFKRDITLNTQRKVAVEAETKLKVTLISRRSINYAGVRYLKRGIDEDGDVANFVETEVVLTIFGHYTRICSNFWTQQGYRYRPPLVISKTFTDSYPAFKKHVTKMTETYGTPLTIVNLVEQRGREMQLAVSFLQHILHMNSPDVVYFTYDFHFRCRGLRFHKLAELISALSEQISTIGFCWVDKSGEIVRQQQGVIRTNCVDCLDRTNVVQCAISQALCLVQAQKLGIVGPQAGAPVELIQALQTMWADNGDAISRQYAGTDALKGDVTRSGQRNLVGMVKDGYNSASRYYLSHMRDAHRQLAVDALLGKFLDAGESEGKQFEGEEDEEEVESIGRLVREAILFILPEKEILVGGWALVEGSNNTDQIDSVLVLTKTALIAASYDDDTKLSDVKRINFDEIRCLEYGQLDGSSRTHLRLCSKSGELFTWRAAKTRLFNNVAILLRTKDEADEYIQAIGEQVKVTMALAGYVSSLADPYKYCIAFSLRRRMMNLVASVFRSRADCSERSQFEHATFSKLDNSIDNAITSSIEVSHVCSSKSDDQFSKTDDFISLLKNFKLTTSRSNDAVTADIPNCQRADFSSIHNPFSQYRQQILDSKSRIILL
ncbi:Phosphatidylinositide phosphatase SAC2 [Dirofilaria immitis]|nr:Phosphatidylinositide phosphatase SAC2 [Dirofilaria immitis]